MLRRATPIGRDDALAQVANEYFQRKMYGEAEETYRKILPSPLDTGQLQMPSVVEREIKFLRLLQARGKTSDAHAQLSKVFDVLAKSDVARCGCSIDLLGQYCLEIGDTNKAQNLFQRIVFSPDASASVGLPFDQLCLQLSEIYLKQKNFEKAKQALLCATKADKAVPLPLIKNVADQLKKTEQARLTDDWQKNSALATVAFQHQKYAVAESSLQKAINDARLLHDDDKLGVVLTNLAAVYHLQTRYSDAEPLYKEAERIFRSQGPRGTSALAKLMTNYDDLLRSTKSANEAREPFQASEDIPLNTQENAPNP